MGSIPYNPLTCFLGVLCKRGHNWNGTGYSVRKRVNNQCVACQLEQRAAQRASAREAREAARTTPRRDSPEYQTWRRDQALRQGVCVTCHRNPHREGRQTCQECADRYRPAASAAQQAKQAQRREDDLCPKCGRPPEPGYTYCRTCLEAKSNRDAQLRATQPDLVKARERAYARQARADVIAAYGGRCRCCGESEPVFLNIDHVYGGGERERRETGRVGKVLYAWLRSHGYPDDYQLLCWNCNKTKAVYGKCAHEMYGFPAPKNSQQAYDRRLREEVLQAYGVRCACCGLRDREFLSIDHIDGGGNEHRREIGGKFYKWLRKQGYPPGFRTLCHNCNQARAILGYCPHERHDDADDF